MVLTDDRNGSKLQKSKRFCAIKDDNVISSIGAPLQTIGAPNTPLWIVHSDIVLVEKPINRHVSNHSLNTNCMITLFMWPL